MIHHNIGRRASEYNDHTNVSYHIKCIVVISLNSYSGPQLFYLFIIHLFIMYFVLINLLFTCLYSVHLFIIHMWLHLLIYLVFIYFSYLLISSSNNDGVEGKAALPVEGHYCFADSKLVFYPPEDDRLGFVCWFDPTDPNNCEAAIVHEQSRSKCLEFSMTKVR